MQRFLFHTAAALTRAMPWLALDRLPLSVPPGEHIIRWRGHSRVHIDLAHARERELYRQGRYEPHICALLDELAAGAVAVDAGANTGWLTLILSACAGASGRVYAFEPNAAVRARLEANLALNPHASNVTVLPQALGDHSGTAQLYLPPADTITGRASLSYHPQDWQPVEVPLTTLDAALPDLPRLDLLKVDVEGHDLLVLRGALRLISAYHPRILIEYDAASWHSSGVSYEDLLALLRPMNYEVFQIPRHRLRGLLRPALRPLPDVPPSHAELFLRPR